MATIGHTTGGRNITVNGAPYDNAAIIFPNDGNVPLNITQDLVGSVTAQISGNTDTPQTDWANGMHIIRSGSRRGQGNIPVVAGSDTDKLFMSIFNALHPLSNSGGAGTDITAAYKKFMFTLKLWNSDETDKNGNPTKVATAEGTFFTTQPQLNMSNGTSNNQQTDSWAYTCAELSRQLGDPNANL